MATTRTPELYSPERLAQIRDDLARSNRSLEELVDGLNDVWREIGEGGDPSELDAAWDEATIGRLLLLVEVLERDAAGYVAAVAEARERVASIYFELDGNVSNSAVSTAA
jgi:hypothetical protein